jgi:hypothetical protein
MRIVIGRSSQPWRGELQMKDLSAQRYYLADDLREAFDMGLDTALFVLEKTAGLPHNDQIEIINLIKQQIENDWEFKPDLRPRIRVVSKQKRQS